MAIVEKLVLGKVFEALYAGVEELIGKNLMFKSLCVDIKSKLSSLKPLIQDMAQYNQQLNCPKSTELEALEGLMKGGIELVGKCSMLRRWNVYNKYKYARKLLELNESLEKQLDILKVQAARDVKKNTVMLRDIGEVVSRLDLAKQNQSTEIKAWCAVPELPPLTVGLDVPLEALKMKLLQEEVSRLVLTAPGGCGKTTLATKFCQDEDVKDKFKNNIFFVTFSNKPNLAHMVKDLYRQKGYQAPTFHSEASALKGLQEFLKEEERSHLLLVIDDVWSGSGSLLEKFDLKMSNYKILVTSRSDILSFGSSYQLQLLNDDNAMKLFHHTASLGDKSSHIPRDLSKKIVKHCNGFPLAITVAGRSLCGQPIEMWQSRVIEWSKGSSILDFETELLLRLQSSLDALDNEMSIVKKCFLDLGSFPEDKEISVNALIDMWAELYDLDEDTLCIAKLYEISNRSLASLVYERKFKIEGDGDYSRHFVKQHDLLRELAIYNSKRGPIRRRERVIIEISGNNIPKWWKEQKYQPIKARLLSISTDGEFSMKWPNMQLPETEVLVLNFQTDNYTFPEFLEKMADKLKVLVVNNYGTIHNEPSNFELLGSLSNLRRIRLDTISLSCITKNPVQLKSLRKISLRNCTAFNNGFVKISETFPTLMEMSIENCILKDPELPADQEICDPIHLTKLNENCLMKELPAELCDLIHLTKLSISTCTTLSVLPEAIGNLVNLEVLRLRNCVELLELPDSIKNLSKLNFLDIHICNKMRTFPEHIGELRSLRKLNFVGCISVSTMPEGIGNLVNLEVLRLRWCTKLLELPDTIRNLKKLNVLDIHNCVKIQELPEHIGELKSLRNLDMSRCMELRKLPHSVLDLEQLEEVICEECDATQLWPPFLPILKNLRLVVYDWRAGPMI